MNNTEALISKARWYFFTLMALIPIIFYISVCWLYAINVPVLDEYRQTLAAQVDIKTLGGWDLFRYIFLYYHNGHHIPIYILSCWLSVEIFGKVNFAALAIIGCGFTVLSFLVILKILTINIRRDIDIAATASIGFFSFAWWENIQMGSQAYNFNLNILAMAASVYSIQRRCILTYSIATLVACWTTANGLVLLPLGLLIPLQWQGRKRNVAYCFIIAWMACLTAIYYCARVGGNIDEASQFKSTLSTDYKYFMAAIGSVVSFGHAPIGILAGHFIIASLMWNIIIKQIRSSVPIRDILGSGPLLLTYAFIGTLAMITFARAGLGVEQALSSRYSIYSCILLVVALHLELSRPKIETNALLRIIFIPALILNTYFWALLGIPQLEHRRDTMKVAKSTWGTLAITHVYPDQSPILNRRSFDAWRLGIYGKTNQFFFPANPNNSATYAVSSKGTFRQFLDVPQGIYINEIKILVGTYGNCSSGTISLNTLSITELQKTWSSSKIPLHSISDNSFITITPPSDLLKGKCIIEIQFDDIAGGNQATIWCGDPQEFQTKYVDPSGVERQDIGITASFGIQRP